MLSPFFKVWSLPGVDVEGGRADCVPYRSLSSRESPE